MVTDALRELIARAPGCGVLDGDDVGRGSGEHPVCGDVVEVSVRLAGEHIADLRWRAQGCPATVAVAAAAAEALVGVTRATAAQALRRRLADLGDLAGHERHAEAMFGRALNAALATAGGG